jgi:hypothetical protein
MVAGGILYPRLGMPTRDANVGLPFHGLCDKVPSMSILEIVMMICFGVAWPFSIHRSWTSGKTGGKSVWFLIIILAGYTAGIANKLFNHFDNVIYLYCLNMAMVFVDTLLWFRNKKSERNS